MIIINKIIILKIIKCTKKNKEIHKNFLTEDFKVYIVKYTKEHIHAFNFSYSAKCANT